MSRRLLRGSLEAWLRPAREGWAFDACRYNFAPLVGNGIRMVVTKLADCTVDIGVMTQRGDFLFRAPMPEALSPRGLFVAIRWREGDIIEARLADTLIGSRPFGIVRHGA